MKNIVYAVEFAKLSLRTLSVLHEVQDDAELDAQHRSKTLDDEKAQKQWNADADSYENQSRLRGHGAQNRS